VPTNPRVLVPSACHLDVNVSNAESRPFRDRFPPLFDKARRKRRHCFLRTTTFLLPKVPPYQGSPLFILRIPLITFSRPEASEAVAPRFFPEPAQGANHFNPSSPPLTTHGTPVTKTFLGRNPMPRQQSFSRRSATGKRVRLRRLEAGGLECGEVRPRRETAIASYFQPPYSKPSLRQNSASLWRGLTLLFVLKVNPPSSPVCIWDRTVKVP